MTTKPDARAPLSDRRPIALLKELLRRFNDDLCWTWAAALSFYVLLSVVPVLMCGIAAVGWTIHDPHSAADQILRILKAALPGDDAGAVAQRIVRAARVEETAAGLLEIRGWAAVFGSVSLVWTASRVFVNATPPMNAAFRAPETRGYIALQLWAVGLLLATGALGGMSLALLYLPTLLRWPQPTPAWAAALLLAGVFALSVLLFTLLYRFLPTPAAKVGWRAAAFGSVVSAALWELARQGFSLYIQRIGGTLYDRFYGSLGGVFLLLLWVYYSSALLLLGAEIAGLWAQLHRTPGGSD